MKGVLLEDPFKVVLSNNSNGCAVISKNLTVLKYDRDIFQSERKSEA